MIFFIFFYLKNSPFSQDRGAIILWFLVFYWIMNVVSSKMRKVASTISSPCATSLHVLGGKVKKLWPSKFVGLTFLKNIVSQKNWRRKSFWGRTNFVLAYFWNFFCCCCRIFVSFFVTCCHMLTSFFLGSSRQRLCFAFMVCLFYYHVDET